MKILKYFSIISIVLLFTSCVSSQSVKKNIMHEKNPENRFDLFVMSQCPYAIEAEKSLLSILDIFKDRIDFRLHFIAQEAGDEKKWGEENEPLDDGEVNIEGKCHGMVQIDPNAQFYSLHGKSEVQEDIRQLIIMKYYPEEFLDYLFWRAENYNTDDWKTAAANASLDIEDIEKIEKLMKGPEGEQLFRENIKRAEDLKIDSSPTLIINGTIYKGRMDKNSLGRYICKNSKPCEACQKIPVCGGDDDCQKENMVGLCIDQDTDQAECQFALPKKVKLTVIRYSLETEEEMDPILSITQELFPKVIIEEIDYHSSQGMDLIDKYDLRILPTYIFPKEVENALRFIRIKDALEEKEEVYILKPDYLLKAHYIYREEKKQSLDLFVESLSGLDNYLEYQIIRNPFLGNFSLKIHFLAKAERGTTRQNTVQLDITKKIDGNQSHINPSEAQMHLEDFRSTRGAPEIMEDIRQLCIAEKDPEKYKQYLTCIHKALFEENRDMTWEGCIQGASIDAQTISTERINSTGVKLLLKDIALSNELRITATPALLINNTILLRNFTIEMIEELARSQNALASFH